MMKLPASTPSGGRGHDVFESGSVLAGNGAPAAGSRALPDGEIAAGTPIPAVVPLPGRPMAPMPGEVHIANGQIELNNPGVPDNPGYPFFIAGRAGHRPPTPPLDILHDGGLPRHVITGGVGADPFEHFETRLNFDKTLHSVAAIQLPEDGTNAEKAAMAYHGAGNRFHDTFLPGGTEVSGPAGFKTNGLAPQQGAPYADPCVDDAGQPVGNPRTYKAAAIQLDMIMNKVGWHFGQSRILSLWNDVADFKSGAKPPEPLFFRANSNDCITLYHTNLVPNVYEADDYQVRTPTDVIGQHIHVFEIHGHAWQREPYNSTSRRIADNPFSQWRSAQEGIGASGHWDMVLENGAGGRFGIKGDYLYRDHNPVAFAQGLWGIFRVE